MHVAGMVTRFGSLQELGRGRACSPPCPELRRPDGRLFVAKPEDVPEVVHPPSPLSFPIHVGSLTDPLRLPQDVRPGLTATACCAMRTSTLLSWL